MAVGISGIGWCRFHTDWAVNWLQDGVSHTRYCRTAERALEIATSLSNGAVPAFDRVLDIVEE